MKVKCVTANATHICLIISWGSFTPTYHPPEYRTSQYPARNWPSWATCHLFQGRHLYWQEVLTCTLDTDWELRSTFAHVVTPKLLYNLYKHSLIENIFRYTNN
ncbi:putative signal peptide protein [Puccinia sorghi]|uniref:Putative signal peptide protein n=1 Tax=Puccinia sorghi TaxID=27349 RepID=A0A0L6VFD3_9BASI|nr:putative signal peptide protein [Puccinia sorghi]